MAMQRVQMLLEPAQRRKLADLAKAQGKSVAEVTRQVIDAGLDQMEQSEQQRQLGTFLEKARLLRERIHQRYGKTLDIDVVEDIRQMREERDEELFKRSR